METTFKRLSKYSKITTLIASSKLNDDGKMKVIASTTDTTSGGKVIQTFTETIGEDRVIVHMEIVLKEDLENYYKEGALKAAGDAGADAANAESYEEILEIELNKDAKPPYKHSGKTLGQILKDDKSWFTWAKTNLRNPFIKDKVERICEIEGL